MVQYSAQVAPWYGSMSVTLSSQQETLEFMHCTSKLEMSQFEQQANIQFCQKLGKTAVETIEIMLQVFGEDALSRSVVVRWHQLLLQGRDSLEDVVCTRRPQIVRTERNKLQRWCVLSALNRRQSRSSNRGLPWYLLQNSD
jgi:hypothetical protein